MIISRRSSPTSIAATTGSSWIPGGFHTFEETAIVDGEERIFLARKFRVSDERNGKHYVCGISTDITSLKQTEQELAAAKVEAERASRAKSQFLAAISHDMRQPIQAASLFLGVLDGRIGDPKAREVLERVKTSIDSVHGMLGDLLDLSRLDAALIKPALKAAPAWIRCLSGSTPNSLPRRN